MQKITIINIKIQSQIFPNDSSPKRSEYLLISVSLVLRAVRSSIRRSFGILSMTVL